jgi:sulfate adenylyltransferase
MNKSKKNENVRKEGKTAKVETKKGQKVLKEELYPIEPHGGKLVIRHFPKKQKKITL